MSVAGGDRKGTSKVICMTRGGSNKLEGYVAINYDVIILLRDRRRGHD